MNQNRCSKCQKDGHGTRACEKPWPFWDKQECDFCGKDQNHDTYTCTEKLDSYPLCDTCGHAGHYIKACKLKNRTEANLRQYTQSRYLIATGKPENAPKTPGKNTGKTSEVSGSSASRRPSQPAHPISGSLPTRPAGNPSGIGNSNTSHASLSNNQGQQSATDRTEQRETTLQIRVSNIRRPKLSEEQEEKLRWTREKFDEVPYSRIPTRDLTVETNFLRVNFHGNPNLHKYRIQLGIINNRTVKKPKVKRALIKRLLHIQRPPNVPFVSDYLEFVISLGPLYPQFTSNVPCAYDVPHLRSAPAGQQPVQMDTVFWFDGRFAKDQLLNYFGYSHNLPAANLVGYHPDQELRNLNVISWNHISDDRTFIGGRSGKKFYPGHFANSILLGTGTTYVVNRGIFSSIRPGRESLLLNINPTTTAFFPYIVLQTWINARWAGGPHLPMPHHAEPRELKDLRVTFAGHTPGANGRRKAWIIFGFSLNPPRFRPMVNGVRQQETSVLDYMQSSKFPPPQS
jgi:hypothetical protein